MSDLQWNSVPLEEEERPTVDLAELRRMAENLDPEEYDEPVQLFLDELMVTRDVSELHHAATMLLQDEVDLAPELAEMGVEPDPALVELLLAAGADPDAPNPYGRPPLHLAAHYGYEELVNLLLAAGASVSVRDREGRYAADVAATLELAARLEPPHRRRSADADDEEPLPPEIEDADYDPDHECLCGDHGQVKHGGSAAQACGCHGEHYGEHGCGHHGEEAHECCCREHGEHDCHGDHGSASEHDCCCGHHGASEHGCCCDHDGASHHDGDGSCHGDKARG